MSQSQPNAFIPLDLRTVDQFGFVKQAAREATREVERMEREVARALQAGKSVDPVLQMRLDMTREILQKNNDILRQQAMNKLEDLWGSRADEKMFKFFAASQFARALAKGEFGAEMAGQLLASRMLPGVLEKFGFIRAGAALGKAGPALNMALFAAEQIQKGFAERDANTKFITEFGKDMAAGRIPPALNEIIQREFEGFRVFGADKEAAQKAVAAYMPVVRALMDETLTPDFYRAAVMKAWAEAGGSEQQYEGAMGALKRFQAEVQKQERLAGQPLTEEETAQIAAKILTTAGLSEKMVEGLAKKLPEARKTAAAAEREKRAAMTPAERYEEIENQHLRKRWANAKRYDLLASLARDDARVFVRD